MSRELHSGVSTVAEIKDSIGHHLTAYYDNGDGGGKTNSMCADTLVGIMLNSAVKDGLHWYLIFGNVLFGCSKIPFRCKGE